MATILQIIPSLNSGGAEQACVDIAAGLQAAGHRAIIVSSGGKKVKDIVSSGARHITRPVESKNLFVMLANALWLRRVIRENKVDIVHARSRAPGWSAYWATRGLPCAYLTTFHAAYKFSSATKKFYNSVMTKADRIIAISNFIASHIRDTYDIPPEKIRIIPRGIDLDQFDPAKITKERQEKLREAWGISEGQTIIFLPARLSSIKGQKVLIEAMALLPPSTKDIIAIIAGDDQGRFGYRHKLDQVIIDNELDEQIKIVPACDDMPAAYSLAALVVAPSLVPEGFGRVPVEAMSMGIPVIASYIGGYGETIRHGVTGWLFSPGDREKLAETIIQALHQTPGQRAAMTHVAVRETRVRYDKRKMVTSTLRVYEEVIRNKP